MVIMQSKSLIIRYEELSDSDKENLLNYFVDHPEKRIIQLDNHRYSTYDQLQSGEEPGDIRVKFGVDMFFKGRDIIAKFGYAVAISSDGENVCVLGWEPGTYLHAYRYTGGADLWFLNNYDCLFLHSCNEYSIILYVNILPFWQGKRVILVGSDWKGLVNMLPEQKVEVFGVEQLSHKMEEQFTAGFKALHIVSGSPHEESLERYEQGVMFYDEVLSFTFLFSDCQSLGNQNPDKKFLVIDGLYGNLGLFALYGKAETVARYAKSRGFMPVIRIMNAAESFYSDRPKDDIWGKFYNQPEQYSLADVMESQNVYFTPVFYNGSIQSHIMNLVSGKTKLAWPKGIYNNKVWRYIKERENKFLPYPDKTLGVLARGTDYVHTHLPNHAIHASKEMIGDKIDEVLVQWECQYLYIATEDEEYCDYFRKRYGDKVFFTDQQRFTTVPGEMLAEMHRRNKKERKKHDGFLLGVEYILSIYLLSRCRSLIASGGCAGVNKALKDNHGKYEHTFIFQMGKNT